VASGVYNGFMQDMLLGNVDLDAGGDTIRVRLHTEDYVPDPDHETTANLDNEVSGAGYDAGGAVLADQTIVVDEVANEVYLNATDLSWAASSVSARYAVLVDVTNSNSLICWIDFGTTRTSDSSIFTIQWNGDGVFRVRTAA
jgi:hypothetical protein